MCFFTFLYFVSFSFSTYRNAHLFVVVRPHLQESSMMTHKTKTILSIHQPNVSFPKSVSWMARLPTCCWLTCRLHRSFSSRLLLCWSSSSLSSSFHLIWLSYSFNLFSVVSNQVFFLINKKHTHTRFQCFYCYFWMRIGEVELKNQVLLFYRFLTTLFFSLTYFYHTEIWSISVLTLSFSSCSP